MNEIRDIFSLWEIDSYEDRLEYLMLRQVPGDTTFGGLRHLNQGFYSSTEWRRVRDEVIIRDNGCDLGIHGREIVGNIVVHHMNPITPRILENDSHLALDPRYLICVSENTHRIIHYGRTIPVPHIDRVPGDTKLW